MRHATPTERARAGKAARARVPRESHAGWTPPASRPDPVELLRAQAETRVTELVPVRYERMLVSPFAYYRGAALPMASDLSVTPVSGFRVQACGDAHLSNFGVFASPDRRLVFDVNDFDETLPAPWEWDVKRLAASLEVAARQNGFRDRDRRAIVLAAAGGYREAMREFAAKGNLEIWYSRADIARLRKELDSQLGKLQRHRWDKGEAKALTADSMRDVRKLTRTVGGQRRIAADPPLVVPLRDLMTSDTEALDIEAILAAYRASLRSDIAALLDRYEIVDVARKVVGVGSVGTRCWIVLTSGRDVNDLLFLQIKEAQESVLARYAGASDYDNQGQRVVAGQWLMQAASDIFLGWQRVPRGLDGSQRDFYVRQLRDWKYSLDIDAMVPRGMRLYGQMCGRTLARAHARTGDAIAIAGYLGKADVFDRAIAEFARDYADQNERDYAAFAAAARPATVQQEVSLRTLVGVGRRR
jgi:uncharacterized protein (DUF2252 family)